MAFQFTGAPPALLPQGSGRTTFNTFSKPTVQDIGKPATTRTSQLKFGTSSTLGESHRAPIQAPRTPQAVSPPLVENAGEDDTTLLRARRQAETSRRALIGAQSLSDAIANHATPVTPQPSGNPDVAFGVSPAVEDDKHTEDFKSTSYRDGNTRIPRDHAKIEEYRTALAATLRKDNFVHHDEGARVLAEFLVKEMYEGRHSWMMEALLQTAFAWRSSLRLTALVVSVATALRALDARYRNGEFHTQQQVKAGDPVRHHGQSLVGILAKLGKETSIMRNDSPTRAATDKHLSQQGIFQFLELPPEMRNRIYLELLAPNGFIILSRFDRRGKKSDNYKAVAHYTVNSGCQLAILRTCKQVYKEGKSILYRENTINIKSNLRSDSGLCLPLLSNPTLPLLATMTLVLDLGRLELMRDGWIDRVNWFQLQALTTLKELRICVVESDHFLCTDEDKSSILKHILERVPADCELSYESNADCEIDLAQAVIEEHDPPGDDFGIAEFEAHEVDGEVLKQLAKEVLDGDGFEAGCKNGDVRDYRFAPRVRSVVKSVDQLIAEGAVDSSIVLGGPY